MQSKLVFCSEEELNAIHRDSLAALGRTGLRITGQRARKALLDAGAKAEGDRILFPSGLVEECLLLKNEKILLGAKTKENRLFLSKSGVMLNTNRGFCPFVLDEESELLRKVEALDILDLCRLLNGMEGVDVISLPRLAGETGEDEGLKLALKYGRKHILTLASDENAAHAQCDRIKNSEEERYFSALVPMGEALCFDGAAAMVLAKNRVMTGIRYHLPLTVGSPGADNLLLLGNVLNLAALVLVKIVDGAAPFLYCGFDSMIPSFYGLAQKENWEFGLVAAGQGQMAAFYGLPAMLFSDLAAERRFESVQGFEKNVRLQALAPMAPGQLFGWLGSVDFGRAYSLTDLVQDGEVWAMAQAYVRDFPADDDALAEAVIDEVGPGGHFLYHAHTLKYFKREIWLKKMGDSFLLSTEKNHRDLAREKVRTLLSKG